MEARLCVLRAGRTLPPGKFVVLISVRGSVDARAIVLPDILGKFEKKKIPLIGTRARDLPVCSIYSASTTRLPRAPEFMHQIFCPIIQQLIEYHCFSFMNLLAN
jgi:hypothetical protein